MNVRPSRIAVMGLALLLAALTPLTSMAAPKPKKGKGGAEAASPATPDKPYQEWKKVLKDSEARKGFLTLHAKRENLYLEIRADQLNQPFLGVWSIARGIGRDFVLGGLSIFNDRVLHFERAGDRVLIVERNLRFRAPAGSPIEKAKDLSHGNSVIASLKIESIHDSTKALLVDFAPFVVSDVSDLGEFLKQNLEKGVRFDKERSALGAVKAFPDNVEVEAILTYSPNDRTGLNLNTVPDDRYIPVTMHYSFSRLPEQPMLPRYADDRTGYFLAAMKDFSRDDKEHFWLRYVTRWRLEKKDPAAALSEPVKPIVFYVDHTVPEKWRPYVKQGIEAWQKAFEAAGFKNAILAKDAPNDSTYDPGDVRFSTIRWITSSEPSFGAIGPSRIDPRTGEILDADILFEASIVQRRWRIYRDLVGKAGEAGLADAVLPALRLPPEHLPAQWRCEAAAGIAAGASLAWLTAALDAAPAPELWERFCGEMLVHTTLHEVGHTLGLTHNFRASTATPRAHLHDRDWTSTKGMTASVMDYATPNIAFDRTKQGEYYGSTPGTADLWMIRYGYTPSGAADSEADYTFARKIADESAQAGHEYSPDPDTYGPDALDPRSNIWDLGDDPLVFGRERTEFVAQLWKNEKLEERILGANGEYPVLRRVMDGLLEQYGIGLGLALKYVGGQYHVRDHRGQPGAREPLQPVPAARQREALDFLAQRAFAVDAFQVSPRLLNRLAPDRWLHWGVADQFGVWTGTRLDYNLHDKVLTLQTTALNGLLTPGLLGRLREAESRSADPLRMAELFDRMTRAIWGEVGGGSAAAMKALDGPTTRRDLQRHYVDRLGQMLVAPAPGLPDDARALARLQLTRIDARCARALAAEAPMGDYTRGHLLESRARVKRAIEAGRDIEGARPGPTATP